jgi:hypothetical protein
MKRAIFILSTILLTILYSCHFKNKASTITNEVESSADSTLLTALTSPILLHGNEHIAYRDPLIFKEKDTFFLYYSYVLEEEDNLIYWYLAFSTSKDLMHWSEPHIITKKDQNLNYSSPGNVFKVGSEWFLCAQTYPIANFRRGDPLRHGDDRARLWLFKSSDLYNWSQQPELIKVKGPEVNESDLGKMIDAFIMRDRDTPDKWWCFYKQSGTLHLSWSMDMKNWTMDTISIARGENMEIIIDDKGEYVLFYAPANGVGVMRSQDLQHWRTEQTILLGQKDWPWCETRLTAGYVQDFRNVPGVGKYVMVWHSMGPGRKTSDANTNANCNIGIAWSDDLKTWTWPGK